MKTSALERIVSSCIKLADIKNASAAAKLAGRTLTRKELADYVRFSIAYGLVEQSAGSVRKVFGRDLSERECNRLVAANVRRGGLRGASKAASLSGRPLTEGEVESAIRTGIRNGNWNIFIDAPELYGRPLTTDEAKSLIDRCLYEENYTAAMHIAKSVQVGAKALSKLMRAYQKAGDLDGALRVCELSKNQLPAREYDGLVNKCLVYDDLEKALRVAELAW